MVDLLPPNATQLERNLAEVNGRLGDLPVPLRNLYDPDTCPSEWLPWLASFFSVDDWMPTWSEAQKRDTIKSSIKVHQLKGTVGAVKRALAALGFNAELQEWFNQIPAGAPYTYRLLLDVTQTGYDKPALAQMIDLVNAAKNLRSHLSEIVPQVVTEAGHVMAGATGVGTEITVDNYQYGLLCDGSVPCDGTYRCDGFKIARN